MRLASSASAVALSLLMVNVFDAVPAILLEPAEIVFATTSST
jgi:hypothetical protein